MYTQQGEICKFCFSECTLISLFWTFVLILLLLDQQLHICCLSSQLVEEYKLSMYAQQYEMMQVAVLLSSYYVFSAQAWQLWTRRWMIIHGRKIQVWPSVSNLTRKTRSKTI